MNDSPYLQADGTRYLLLLCQWGGYVIDRSYRIRRVQLRAPATSAPHPHKLFGCGPCPTAPHRPRADSREPSGVSAASSSHEQRKP